MKNFRKFLIPVALVALMLVSVIASADNLFNWGQDRYFKYNPVNITPVTAATYTLKMTDDLIVVNAASNNINLVLPTIKSTVAGNAVTYTIRRSDSSANTVTILAATTDAVTNTIEGRASIVLPISNDPYLPTGYNDNPTVTGTTGYPTLQIGLRQGYDWKVFWIHPLVQSDMYTGSVYINSGLIANTVMTTPTVSTTYAAADCGKTISVATDALTFQLGTLPAGCSLKFINTGTAGNNIITIKLPTTQAAQGSCTSAAALNMTILNTATGSTLTNTKSTAKAGDQMTLTSISTTSIIISGCTGTWASS